jgi:hypothetical protein
VEWWSSGLLGELSLWRVGVTECWFVAIYTPTCGKTHVESGEAHVPKIGRAKISARRGFALPLHHSAPQPPGFFRRLDVKSEFHHVSVLDDIIFSFDTELACFSGFRK